MAINENKFTEMEDYIDMKKIERRNRIFQTVVIICVVISMVLGASQVSYAATPTMGSKFATLIVGTNDLKVENYDGTQTMAGRFTAPKKVIHFLLSIQAS